MKENTKKLKSVFKWIGTAFNVLLVIIVLVNLYTIAARFITKKSIVPIFGITNAIVDTGSMEGDKPDSIPAKSLIFLVKSREYEVNDIIMFQGKGSIPVTHRIIGVDEDGFITKGDANNTEDEDRVKKEQIIGKVFLKIPKVGYVIGWMKTPLGSMLLVMVCFLLICAPMLLKPYNTNAELKEFDDKNEQDDTKNPNS